MYVCACVRVCMPAYGCAYLATPVTTLHKNRNSPPFCTRTKCIGPWPRPNNPNVWPNRSPKQATPNRQPFACFGSHDSARHGLVVFCVQLPTNRALLVVRLSSSSVRQPVSTLSSLAKRSKIQCGSSVRKKLTLLRRKRANEFKRSLMCDVTEFINIFISIVW